MDLGRAADVGEIDLGEGHRRIHNLRTLRRRLVLDEPPGSAESECRIDQKEIGDFSLDPSMRELQSVALDTKGKTVRIEILEVTPGSKKNWREVCVSELQVWGLADSAVAGTKVPVVRVSDEPKSCPDKTRLAEVIRSKSTTASKGRVFIDRCVAAGVAGGRWYVTATVKTPSTQNDVIGRHFLLRSLVDHDGNVIVMREDEDDPSGPMAWDSVQINGDEAIEELSGGEGVVRRDRIVFSIRDNKITQQSNEHLGEYGPDGTYTPTTK